MITPEDRAAGERHLRSRGIIDASGELTREARVYRSRGAIATHAYRSLSFVCAELSLLIGKRLDWCDGSRRACLATRLDALGWRYATRIGEESR